MIVSSRNINKAGIILNPIDKAANGKGRFTYLGKARSLFGFLGVFTNDRKSRNILDIVI